MSLFDHINMSAKDLALILCSYTYLSLLQAVFFRSTPKFLLTPISKLKIWTKEEYKNATIKWTKKIHIYLLLYHGGDLTPTHIFLTLFVKTYICTI